MDMYNAPSGFGDFLNEMPTFFKIFGGILLVIVIGVFAYIIINGLRIWTVNNNSEVLERKSKIVDKRTEVSGGAGDSSASTNYYTTFEFEDGSRKELYVNSKNFSLMVVGDIGQLIYQGTRFKEFNRQTNAGQ